MRHIGLTLAAAVITTCSASAHPGHGSPAAQDGILHYVANPSHLVPWILSVAAVWTGIRVFQTRQRKSAAKATVTKTRTRSANR